MRVFPDKGVPGKTTQRPSAPGVSGWRWWQECRCRPTRPSIRSTGSPDSLRYSVTTSTASGKIAYSHVLPIPGDQHGSVFFRPDGQVTCTALMRLSQLLYQSLDAAIALLIKVL